MREKVTVVARKMMVGTSVTMTAMEIPQAFRQPQCSR
jgi:hypothetical protein